MPDVTRQTSTPLRQGAVMQTWVEEAAILKYEQFEYRNELFLLGIVYLFSLGGLVLVPQTPQFPSLLRYDRKRALISAGHHSEVFRLSARRP